MTHIHPPRTPPTTNTATIPAAANPHTENGYTQPKKGGEEEFVEVGNWGKGGGGGGLVRKHFLPPLRLLCAVVIMTVNYFMT